MHAILQKSTRCGSGLVRVCDALECILMVRRLHIDGIVRVAAHLLLAIPWIEMGNFGPRRWPLHRLLIVHILIWLGTGRVQILSFKDDVIGRVDSDGWLLNRRRLSISTHGHRVSRLVHDFGYRHALAFDRLVLVQVRIDLIVEVVVVVA